MSRLPSRGRCYAAFLLAYSARISTLPDQGAWVENAKSRSTIMAAASDIAGTANLLIDSHLAQIGEGIELDENLLQVSFVADRITLLAIARLILECYPPGWLRTSTVGGRLSTDLIPDADITQLKWIGDDLEPLLLHISLKLTTGNEEDLRKQIGNAGELAVMSALYKAGFKPRHVALVSDAYGYDIAYESDGTERKVEVKTCVPSTQRHVYISRNEFDKAIKHAQSWRLVQVIFSSSIILNRSACASDVLQIRELQSSKLVSLAPKDTAEFRWLESAKLEPKAEYWHLSELTVDDDYKFDFGSLS
jgi:hypothetical protein